jgi:hypothetical protein
MKKKSTKNALGDPLTVYITDEQKEKLQKLADHRKEQMGGEAKVSLTAMIRLLINEAPEPKEKKS